MEKLVNRNKVTIITVAKTAIVPMTIVVSVATLYFILTMAVPQVSFTGGSWFGFRVADSLKALILLNPFTNLGINIGALSVNLYSGRSLMSFYAIMPMIGLLVGFLAYKVSVKIGQKSHVKNLLVLAVYTAIMVTVIRINHTVIAYSAFATMEAQIFFWSMWFQRFVSAMVAIGFGYPLFIGFSALKEKMNKDKEV